MRQNRKTRCQICGDVSKGVYYTATSCKSCMDFFRRCVIYKKQYKGNIDSQVCPIKTSVRDYRTPYQCTLSSRLQIVRDRPQSIFESLFTVSRSMKPNSEKNVYMLRQSFGELSERQRCEFKFRRSNHFLNDYSVSLFSRILVSISLSTGQDSENLYFERYILNVPVPGANEHVREH